MNEKLKSFLQGGIIGLLSKNPENKKAPTSGFATASLVLGIISILLGWFPIFGWVFFILAITFAVIALKKIDQRLNSGRGLAVAGMILGVVSLIFAIVALISFLHGADGSCNDLNCFVASANQCKSTTYEDVTAAGTFKYSITSDHGNCTLTKTVVSLKDNDDPTLKKILGGKEMHCVYSSGKFNSQWTSSLIEGLEDCSVLSYSGENAINLVFLSSEERAKKYMDFFFGYKPFSDEEYKDSFNFFLIENHEVECDIYKGIALLCPQKDVARRASACPNDYIIISEERESSIRSSAYMNVMSLNEKHKDEVFMHELGHALGGLAEEYVDNRAKIPRGSKNCLDACDGFGQTGIDSDGCFEGCTKSDHFRSIDNGVMRTLTPGVIFGKFDENLLRDRIDEDLAVVVGITGRASGITGRVVETYEDCKDKTLVRAEFDIVNGELRKVSEKVAPGCASGTGYGADYGYKIISNGETVVEKGFDPKLLRVERPGELDENGNIPIVSDTFELDNFVVEAQVRDGIDKLNLIDPEGRVVEINLKNAGARPCKV